MKRPIYILCLLIFIGAVMSSRAQETLVNNYFRAEFSSRGLQQLTDPADSFRAPVIEKNHVLGELVVKYRIGEGDWLDIYTDEREKQVSTTARSVTYTDNLKGMPFSMEQMFQLQEDHLDWTITLESQMYYPVLLGDVAIPFPWNQPYGDRQVDIFERSFIKHSFISGNGSFLYFTKPSGNSPILLVTVLPGTSLEYFTVDRGYAVYVHSGLAGNRNTKGSWRQEQTYATLDPKGGKNTKISMGLRFHWADSYDQLRRLLYEEGLFDTRVVPGMSIPSDLSSRFSLHTKATIDSIVAEYPGQTTLRYLGESTPDYHLYDVSFARLGENMLTIYYNGNQKTYLEFFSTEPLETLIKKRSAFIVNHQQHRDTSTWYNGLYSVFDMRSSVLRGPDNTDGFDYWWGYVLACDDPALCKAPFVAAKNVFFPDDKEITSVEYYLEHFVWNGLQRTDKDQPYSYGIYGTPNWKVARDTLARAGVKNRNLDKMNIWRSYDYPHMIMLYYHMYQIAKLYPEKVHYLNASGYLERAYQTARAYWIYPYEILPWYETYKIGCYNELVILNLADDLEKEGFPDKATWLRKEWEKKVKYFVYDDPYPYGSEYSIDRTAFESSYALAKYGVQHPMQSDHRLWWDTRLKKWYSHPVVSPQDSRNFMDRQLYAGLSVRGWLEPAYYLLGSDWTTSADLHCLSYMAKMGGWAILDYGIHFADQPWDWLQLGYASYLSSWCLMNTGTAASNYGYWFPGPQNDGATGWAFTPAKSGWAWIRKEVGRGAWPYDGEADLGYGAAIRTAITLLAKDPLFGWISYGGSLTIAKNEFSIIPRDGLRVRFGIVASTTRITIALNRDGMKAETPVHISRDLKRIDFTLENRTGSNHQTELVIEVKDKPVVRIDNHSLTTIKTGAGWSTLLPVSREAHAIRLEFR